MDVRIGLAYTARELELELPDDTDVDALRGSVDTAFSGGGGVLWFTDKKGDQIAVATEKITFVQVGAGTGKGHIGFG